MYLLLLLLNFVIVRKATATSFSRGSRECTNNAEQSFSCKFGNTEFSTCRWFVLNYINEP